MAELARQWDGETGVYDVGKEIGVVLKFEKENALDSGKGKILKGIREQSSKTITTLYLKTTQPQEKPTNSLSTSGFFRRRTGGTNGMAGT